MEWRRYKRRGFKTPKLVARKQVGHKMTVSVSVEKHSSAACLLEKAVEAFKLVDPEIKSVQKFHLLYPDLQSGVRLIPGSSEEFTPERYVELLGTYYSKVKLYLVTASDWTGALFPGCKYVCIEPPTGLYSIYYLFLLILSPEFIINDSL